MTQTYRLLIGSVVVFTFYSSYLLKMALQRQNGIKTNQLGQGNKPKKTLFIEKILRFVSISMIGIQMLSIIFIRKINLVLTHDIFSIIGTIISVIGLILFITAMVTMKNSWRAGVDKNQDTKLVTQGIFKFSRNPAFVGFDLFYMGIALLYPNIYHLILSFVAIIVFHLQILEEEKFLSIAFGKNYLFYKNKTMRYLGTKKERN